MPRLGGKRGGSTSSRTPNGPDPHFTMRTFATSRLFSSTRRCPTRLRIFALGLLQAAFQTPLLHDHLAILDVPADEPRALDVH